MTQANNPKPIRVVPHRVWVRGRWYEEASPHRMWSRVEHSGDCWLWTGATANGYGRIRIGGRSVSTHRAAYELLIGPIPDGLQIDHLCRNKLCCNPAHLEPVTVRENLLRGDTFNARNAAKTVCHLGHPLSGDNLYIAVGRRHCRTCRREASRRRRAAA